MTSSTDGKGHTGAFHSNVPGLSHFNDRCKYSTPKCPLKKHKWQSRTCPLKKHLQNPADGPKCRQYCNHDAGHRLAATPPGARVIAFHGLNLTDTVKLHPVIHQCMSLPSLGSHPRKRPCRSCGLALNTGHSTVAAPSSADLCAALVPMLVRHQPGWTATSEMWRLVTCGSLAISCTPRFSIAC